MTAETWRVGDRVRIERDETRYPSRGTWPQFRGRTGTVVEINGDEYGVVFGSVKARTDGRGAFNHRDIVTWFKAHEMVREARIRDADGAKARPAGEDTGQAELTPHTQELLTTR